MASNHSNGSITVQEVIDKVLLDMCGGHKFEQTCDIITTGSPDSVVTGIVTTFMPTFDVIQEAVRIGANFIISHEPTWFNGADLTDWCRKDSVYLAKRKYLEEHNITIWRLHDHMHMGSDTDYIYKGLLDELDWHKYVQPDEKAPWIYEIPETTVAGLAQFFKEKLRAKVCVHLAAERAIQIIFQAAVAGGDIPVPVGNTRVPQINEAADTAVIQKHIGQAIVPMGQHRIIFRPVLLQPRKKFCGRRKRLRRKGFGMKRFCRNAAVFHVGACLF